GAGDCRPVRCLARTVPIHPPSDLRRRPAATRRSRTVPELVAGAGGRIDDAVDLVAGAARRENACGVATRLQSVLRGDEAIHPVRRVIVRKIRSSKVSHHNDQINSSAVAGRRFARIGKPPLVAIVGGGRAGLGAAWRLARLNKAGAVVIEQRDDVGGNSGSFDLGGLPVDYGSHRLHPACHPEILRDLRELLRDDLLDRPRHGRIRLRGRWIHFPLKPLDLLFELPLSFGLDVARDALRKFMPRSQNCAPQTFSSLLEHSWGRAICRDFYFPYAVKIWGAPPQELSAIQARRRVSAGSLARMARKALNSVPGFKPPGAGRFFYPRRGFGQISRAIADAARAEGAAIQLGATVRQLRLGAPHRVEIECGGKISGLEADYVWSTIPITALARIANPPAPRPVIEASRRIRYRAMVLVYLVIEQPQFTPFDAHYFPETEIRLTRF